LLKGQRYSTRSEQKSVRQCTVLQFQRCLQVEQREQTGSITGVVDLHTVGVLDTWPLVVGGGGGVGGGHRRRRGGRAKARSPRGSGRRASSAPGLRRVIAAVQQRRRNLRGHARVFRRGRLGCVSYIHKLIGVNKRWASD